MDTVVLRAAFEWKCPKCKAGNFNRAVAVEFTDSDREELLELFDLKEDEVGDMIQAPAIVKCGKCLEKFRTEDDDDFLPDPSEDGE